jgi:ATP-binding cassette subfamily B protein/ATP-binding cassette subfamily C protein
LKIPIKQYWQLLVTYLKPLKRRVIALSVLLLTSIGLQIVNPQVIRYFIDAATEGTASTSKLTIAALLFLVMAIIQQITAVAATYFSEDVAWKATNRLRRDLAMHCLRLDMSFHNRTTPGELIERIETDVTALANFFSQFTIRIFGNLILLVGVLIVLFLEDWRIGLAFTVFALLTLYILNKLRSIAIPHWRDAHAASAEVFGFLEERLAGTEDIRSSGANKYALYRFDEHLNKRVKRWQKAWWHNYAVIFVLRGLRVVNVVIAMALGYMLLRGDYISLGTAYIVVYYTDVLFRPLEQITQQIQELQRAGGSIIRIQELYAETSHILDVDKGDIPQGPLLVSFDNVTFRYNDEEVVLQEVDFTLQPGRVIGLLGRTGAGKSTIARLLFRLYDVTDGGIGLGGVDLRDTSLEQVRRSVGMVTQDVQLFRGTIRDNITFFDNTISDERIMAVMDELGLREWVASLTDGLDTELEFDGRGLSAGEGQLLAFTRVFLRDPGLIIMDEASSRLDPATEMLIERAVDKLLKDRTGIIIAHRLKTVERADEIMILEKGRILEHGERRALAADASSHFAKLLKVGLEEVLA